MLNQRLNRRAVAPWNRAAALALVVVAGCTGTPEPDEIGTTSAALVVSSEDVLGFEDPAGWSASGATRSSTTIRTQDSAALQLGVTEQLVKLTSAPLSSTAADLTGLGEPGSQFAIDVMLPAPPVNPRNPGSLQLLVSSRSRGLKQVSLGQVCGSTPPAWRLQA